MVCYADWENAIHLDVLLIWSLIGLLSLLTLILFLAKLKAYLFSLGQIICMVILHTYHVYDTNLAKSHTVFFGMFMLTVYSSSAMNLFLLGTKIKAIMVHIIITIRDINNDVK